MAEMRTVPLCAARSGTGGTAAACEDDGMVDDPEPGDEVEEHWRRDAARQRLEFLDAITAALERRVEVMELIASSPSADEARERVAALLGVSEVGATAVLDLQWRRFAQLERSRIAEDRDQMRREIG